MRIIQILFVFLLFGYLLISCERDMSPLEIESTRSAGLRSPKNGQYYTEKLIEGQVCRIYYSDKIPSATGWPDAPDSIKLKAKNYLINQTGELFFDSNFQLRSTEIIPMEARSQIHDECYVVSWYFNIRISDYSTYQTVACYLDSAGNIVRQEGITGLAFIKDTKTPFTVTDTIAVEIGMQFGLDPGISYWSVSFYYYHGNVQKYAWNVANYIDGYTRNYLIIDSNKPEVLKSDIWILVDGDGW
jgi:hypothetical protein